MASEVANPQEPRLTQELANRRDKRMENEALVEVIRQTLQAQPDHPTAGYDLALVSHRLERWGEAADLYQEVLRRTPEDDQARLMFARVAGARSGPAETLIYKLPRPDYRGRTEIVLTPQEFLQRLADLIPPPRMHRHRYYGCFVSTRPCARLSPPPQGVPRRSSSSGSSMPAMVTSTTSTRPAGRDARQPRAVRRPGGPANAGGVRSNHGAEPLDGLASRPCRPCNPRALASRAGSGASSSASR